MQTTLLCTFCTKETLQSTLKTISDSYNIAFGTIYVLEDMELEDSLCCTYNVDAENTALVIPEATISLHRKKATNTLYTINALNLLIADLNDGKIGRDFKVPWEEYKNMILVTAYNKLKKVHTKLVEIVNVENINRDNK